MSKQMPTNWDVIIVGGGPAGFFAAIRCADLNPHLRVLLIEKAQQTLGKVLISGGGRCNVTHACFNPAQLVTYYPRGGSALRGAFTRFQPADTVKWFEERGVKLKAESDGRMFPVTDSSKTIADCLRTSASRAGVSLRTGTSLKGLARGPRSGFVLTVQDETGVHELKTSQLLMATGGDSKTQEMVKALGHSIAAHVPSLFTFNISDKRIEGLAGVTVESVTVKLDSLTQRGPLLITHWGMSGPAVLKLSAGGARLLSEKQYRAAMQVNWLGDTTFDKALDGLQRHKEFQENARRKALNEPAFTQLPVRLWKGLAQDIVNDKKWGEVSKAELRQLAQELTAGQFEISGKGQFKEEFVTCGGVCLDEVDFKTMQSRLVPRLYFAGEVLDIDGITGGFNFQSAWTTGWLAGSAMSTYLA
jgi:predicted Rossmann fold flavoprotein